MPAKEWQGGMGGAGYSATRAAPRPPTVAKYYDSTRNWSGNRWKTLCGFFVGATLLAHSSLRIPENQRSYNHTSGLVALCPWPFTKDMRHSNGVLALAPVTALLVPLWPIVGDEVKFGFAGSYNPLKLFDRIMDTRR
eukprot:TRINITY_DN33779_c0_g1_i1.p2 TRINITY_DN33779_c0_g1~~TRINITY_DN33779_c0_g1_i1.p2  ORF type:complete len:161 (+),score=29.49 TRINITY_DN33779_c0_g1_i1:75-485(+)